MKNVVMISTVICLIGLMWFGIFENQPIPMIIGSGGMFILWIRDAIKTNKAIPGKK